MGIAGLGTYSSTSFYYKMTSQGNNTNINDKFDLGLVPGQNNNQDETADTVGKPARTSVTVPYTRCITTTIQTEEMYASQSENGEMVYSYKASEQSFNIYINSDGQNKTYSIEGIDKDGQPFTKEFDPYDVDPEYADFPEFSALCLYIQNTDETADMLANDYFATDDILEKCNYLEKLQGFGTDTIFEKAQSMLDLANKLVNTLQQITDMRSELDSFFGPFFTKYLVEDVDLDDYPDIAGKISEELSSEKVNETTEPEERVTPLGFGFANAGMMGYGMSAALVEKPGCDDTIIRVKLATGSGDEVIDVNLSNFDPKNATPVEMFAYCQYKDAIGEGVNNKWGSWNALKGIALTENGADFGSLDNIMNKKINWNHALAKSQTSYMDPKTNQITLSTSDLIKLLEDSHKLIAQDHNERKDWREMSDEEWDKLLEGIDKYIDAFRERLQKLKAMQEESAKKAVFEADSDMRTTAASSATLSAAASGLGGATVSEVENDVISAHGEVFDKAAPNAPAIVKEAWMDAAKATGYLEGGKMNHISQLLIRQVTNRENGVEDYQNVFGSSVASAMQAARELLYDLENPLSPISERGENAREFIEQEKEFYKKFIDILGNIA